MSITPLQSSLPVNYYAPLSQRATVSNGYNILDQTQQNSNLPLNNYYPDFRSGIHDPTMAQQRAQAQQIAQSAIQQFQPQFYTPNQQNTLTPQSYGLGATTDPNYMNYGLQNTQNTQQPFLQIPNDIQTITSFVAAMAPQLMAMGAMQMQSPQTQEQQMQAQIQAQMQAQIPTDPWPMPTTDNPLLNDIRSDILNHLAKGNINIEIEEELEEVVTMDPISIHENAQIWGDPHFVGADGGKFDVQGEAGKIYNILSDKNLQLNAEFVPWGNLGATAIGHSGITLGSDQIEILKDGRITINGTEYNQNGLYLNDMVEKLGNNIVVRSDEYDLEFITQGTHMDIHFGSDNAVRDNVLPQGLWGGTVDGDGLARNGDEGAGAQGGGGIMTLDGTIAETGDIETVQQYELDDIFNNDFTNFNSFYS